MNPTLLQVALTEGTIKVGKSGLFEGRYIGNLPDGKPIILGIVGDETALDEWLARYPTAENWERESKSPFAPTEFQKILCDTYAGGEYTYLLGIQYSYLWGKLEVEDVGDSSFLALWRELSAREDCVDMDTAIQRMETAEQDIHAVLEALRNAQMHDNDEENE